MAIDFPVLLVHNYYQQPGGEDEAFKADCELLERFGHTVFTHTVHNDEIQTSGQLTLAAKSIWNADSYQTLKSLLRERRPRVVHFHNTFPLISPAAYYAASEAHVPVVQTLHNYRLLCLKATLFRDGHPCEDCLGKPPFAGIQHSCYRNDRLASGVVFGMLSAHRLARTWSRRIQTYIALTEFARDRFVRGGLPVDKVVVRPNFVANDIGPGTHTGDFALFVGRLSEEKGIDVLLRAWRMLPSSIPLKMVGDGPLRALVQAAVEHLPNVTWLGRQSGAAVRALMQTARTLVLPSIWFEGFPMVIAEACSAGLPIVGSDLGSISSLVQHTHSGLLVKPGDPTDLAAAVEWIWQHPDQALRWSLAARATYEAEYTPERSYARLMNIYARAEHAT